MASRNELAVRARAVGLDPNTVPNDSKLEQKLLWLEKNASTFSGTAATGTLTDASVKPTANDTVTIGSRTYTWVTALTEGTATTTLTSTGTAPTDGDSVSVGGQQYVFRTTLTNTVGAPNEVWINGSAANALSNLKAAINASGTAGTNYGLNTLANPKVNATTLTSTTLIVVADLPGAAGNSLDSQAIVGTTLSWTGAYLSGGADPVPNQVLIGAAVSNCMTNLAAAINGTSQGSLCSTGTGAHSDVTAGAATATTVPVTSSHFTAGQSIATTVSSTGAAQAWGAATLTGGVAKVVAADNSTYNGGGGLSGDKDV